MKRAVMSVLPIILGIGLVAGLLLFMRNQPAEAAAASNQTQVIDAGLAYIRAQQQADGGITGFSGASDPDTTARSVLAFVAAGQTPSQTVSTDGKSMMDYLATQAITFTHDSTGTLFPGRAGELLAAVSATGADSSKFGGMDLVKELEASYLKDTGAYSSSAKQDSASGAASDLNQAWAILGLSLAGKSLPEGATQYLVKSQGADGSWGAGDPDTTALAATALLASHNLTAKDKPILDAIGYFHATQADSGGWKPGWDTDPLNADSTGWIIQALVSAGEDVRGQSWTKNNTNPVDALLGLQKPDGAIGGAYANTYSTAEAILGLAGVPLSGFVQAPPTQKVGLAIFASDSSVITDCISFSGNINGLQLLQMAKVPIETSTNPTQGTAVCKIGDVGDSSSNCFGSMPNYWAYWVLGKKGWDYSPVGADQSPVQAGWVYGWSWGTGNPPPVLTYQNICEGVAFTLPTPTTGSTPAVGATQPNTAAAQVPTLNAAQPGSTASRPVNTSSYIIYAAILLALAVLIIYLIRARRG